MGYFTYLTRVEREIRDERERQDLAWGEQNHPDGTGGEIAEIVRDAARDACRAAAEDGQVTWARILTEEVFEGVAESEPARLRAELVQTAAVCVAWIEAIDRRSAPAGRDLLIDPDCASGKCGSCVGGPCEHSCHGEVPRG